MQRYYQSLSENDRRHYAAMSRRFKTSSERHPGTYDPPANVLP